MRMIRRLLTIAVTAALALIATPEATAGGPTSVIIVNPPVEQTGSLYNSDDEYQKLQSALEPAKGAATRDDLGGGGPGTDAINMTWLLHDVTVWRVDRVKINGKDDVWVQTFESMGADSDELWQGVVKPWHKPQDPAALIALLGEIGVLDSSTVSQQTAHDGAVAAQPTDTAGIGANWWWTLPGIAAGLGLGAVGRPRIGAWLRNRDRGPRQQLIDT